MIVNKTSWGFVLSGAQQLFEDVTELQYLNAFIHHMIIKIIKKGVL